MLSQLSRDHSEALVSGPALDELMARNDGLVHAVLRRQWGGPLSYDERLQVGRIGLWHALVGYGSKHGTTSPPTPGRPSSTKSGEPCTRPSQPLVRPYGGPLCQDSLRGISKVVHPLFRPVARTLDKVS